MTVCAGNYSGGLKQLHCGDVFLDSCIDTRTGRVDSMESTAGRDTTACRHTKERHVGTWWTWRDGVSAHIRRGMSVRGGRGATACRYTYGTACRYMVDVARRRVETSGTYVTHYTPTCETRIRAGRCLAFEHRIRCEDLERDVLKEDCVP
jgi:hypothetical protein